MNWAILRERYLVHHHHVANVEMGSIGSIDVIPDEGWLVLPHGNAWLARPGKAGQQLDHPHREGDVLAWQGAEEAHQDGEQVPVNMRTRSLIILRTKQRIRMRMAYMRSSPLPTP